MDVQQVRKQAKELVRAARAGDAEALGRLRGRDPILANAQLVLAREHGYRSWRALLAAAADSRSRRAVADWLGRVDARQSAKAKRPRAPQALEPQPAPTPALAAWRPDLETLRFAYAEPAGDLYGPRFFVITFDADHDRLGRVRMHGLVAAEQDRAGRWVARGFGFGAGDGTEKPSHWTTPRANLAGSWSKGGFVGGGRVHGGDVRVERVRLLFEDGTSLEATADAGWVFFFSDSPVARDASVQLIDDAGAIVATRAWRLRHR